jgi:hypothetical protein
VRNPLITVLAVIIPAVLGWLRAPYLFVLAPAILYGLSAPFFMPGPKPYLGQGIMVGTLLAMIPASICYWLGRGVHHLFT